MPSYHYKARDLSGRAHEGIEVATSEAEVLRILEESRLVPISVELRHAQAAAAGDRVPTLARGWSDAVDRVRHPIQPGSVALLARQLATMIAAGLPLVRSLRSIARDHHDRRLASIIAQVADDVQKGDALSTALSRHPVAFDEVFVSLVRTGEVSGTLDTIMDQTAGYLERSETLRLKVQAALRYPTFVLGLAAAILAAMVLKIIPMFATIYTRFRVKLPWPTQLLLSLSEFATRNLPLLLAAAVLIGLAAWNWGRTPAGRLALDSMRFHMPVFGSLIRMYAITRFARTLGILVGSGTQLLYALKVMRPVPGNRLLEQAIEAVGARVESGVSLSRAMSETGEFPEMLVQMTATGEETGKLDNMLSRTADFYEQRVTAAVDGLSSLVEPIAIVTLGIVVGLVLLALYLPIFNLGQAMRSGIIPG